MAAGRLNWWGKNPAWSKGLLDAIKNKQTFLTIRRGNKDALELLVELHEGINIDISIDNMIVGQAVVVALHIGPMSYFKTHFCSLLGRNIGAKDWGQALRDMQAVYGLFAISEDSIISIIEMRGLG